MKKLMVYGGRSPDAGGRWIAAGYTKADILRTLQAVDVRITKHEFDGWWGVTGNEVELRTAKSPGVWAAENDDRGFFARYKRKEGDMPKQTKATKKARAGSDGVVGGKKRCRTCGKR